jgi:hypothetical protein
VSSRIVDQTWSVRAGLDQVLVSSKALSLSAGCGVSYSESRSWLDTRLVSDAGPRGSSGAVGLRIRGEAGLSGRFLTFSQLDADALRAHAESASQGLRYHWWGHSTTIAVGVGYVLRKGN